MNREDFGRLIAALRKEHGDEALKPWTQTMLAEEANLAAGVDLFTKDMTSNVERGKRGVDQQGLHYTGNHSEVNQWRTKGVLPGCIRRR